MTTIASATPGASRVPKAEVTGKLAAGWLTAAAVLADLGLGAGVAGDLLYGSGANALARLPIATAGRVLVAGASAPAWSDSGLSYASGVLTVAGSVPGTPSAGQVAIGGGVVKAGTAVYGADGSGSAPGLRTTTYAHGLYSASATALGFTVAGTGVATLTNGGVLSVSRLQAAGDIEIGPAGSMASNAYYSGGWKYRATNYATAIVDNGSVGLEFRSAVSGAADAALTWVAGLRVAPTAITALLPLTFPNGTAAAPGIKTSENHGLYRSSATTLGIAAAGLPSAAFGGANGSTFGGCIILQTPSAAEFGSIFTTSTNSYLLLSGSSGSGSGGQTRLYGSAHATKANYVEFTRAGTVSAYFDSSGVLTVNSTTTAGVASGALVCSGGGYFGKAVFSQNDASGVHYYGNSGLTMRDLGTGTSTYLDLAFGSASHGAYNIRSSNAATVRFNIDTSGHVTLGGTAGNYLNINNATGELRINGTKVSGPRDTGWTAMIGTTDKATAYDTATVTLPQLAGRVMALQAALTAHGKIGT